MLSCDVAFESHAGSESHEVDLMPSKAMEYPKLVRLIREQLDISQEDLARELGVSLASVNRWEHGQAKPSKLAKAQLEAFCARMTDQGKLKLPDSGA